MCPPPQPNKHKKTTFNIPLQANTQLIEYLRAYTYSQVTGELGFASPAHAAGLFFLSLLEQVIDIFLIEFIINLISVAVTNTVLVIRKISSLYKHIK